MSWRVIVISKRAKLDLQLGYMVVRSEEVRLKMQSRRDVDD